MTVDELRKKINNLISRSLKQRDIARIAGISEGALSRFLNGDSNLNYENGSKLIQYLENSVTTTDKIKMICKYFDIDYGMAQNLYTRLKAAGLLKKIIDHPGDIATEEERTKWVKITCPECGSDMKVKEGKYGQFWSCVRYPKCEGTRDIKNTKKPTATDIAEVSAKLTKALKYIEEMGSVDEAQKWLGVAVQSLS